MSNKIGTEKNLAARLSALQCDEPRPHPPISKISTGHYEQLQLIQFKEDDLPGFVLDPTVSSDEGVGVVN